MAIKKVIESDLSGRQDAERVTFGLGETWYEIDLTDDERQGLEAALKSYLAAGRKATQEPPKPRKMVPTTTPEEREKIREWGGRTASTSRRMVASPKRSWLPTTRRTRSRVASSHRLLA
ncbi:hypothetical protein AHiyo8_01420 [Arthrobacter sp. Hiyo8]|nr:hypothetical protein AHiyo8_01420 [Arthrobacter sp. Hiyo8]